MTRTLTFRPLARVDLADIWAFTVERWSEAQADRYFEGLNEVLALLCAHPEIARLNEALTPPARHYFYRAHLVIFTADEGAVEVIRVVQMRSDWWVSLLE